MANTTVTKTKSVTLWNEDGWTNIIFDAITQPAGSQFIRWKMDTGAGSQVELRDVSYNAIYRNTWYDDKSRIDCSSNFNAPRFQSRFTYPGGHVNVEFTLTVEFGASYTAVTAGNKILATDRSQTGTTTTAGTVMQDSHFTAGTKIEASTFNSQVLGL